MGLSFLWRGILLGLSIAAPVGPVGALCIRRTLTQGRLVGFISGLGAATADLFYGAIAALGLTAVSGFLTAQQTWLRAVGGAFLLYLGLRTLFSQPAAEAASVVSGRSLWRAYFSTLLLTLTNPITILSFVTIFAGLGLAESRAGYLDGWLLVLGVLTGSAVWWLLLSSAVGLFRRHITAGVLVWVNRAAAAVIIGFGIWILIGILL